MLLPRIWSNPFSKPHFAHLYKRDKNTYLARWENEYIQLNLHIVPPIQELSLVTKQHKKTSYCTAMTK